MIDEEQTANGVIKHSISLDQLLEIFIANNLTAKIAQSAHYNTGRCIRLNHGEARLTFELRDSFTYLIYGESGKQHELEVLCETTSNILGFAQIIHEIELYNDDNTLQLKKTFG